MSVILGMLPSVLMIVAPILIAAVGGMICEKSGVVNIALEGLMGIGACTAASAHVLMEAAGVGGSVWFSLLLGAVVGGVFSIIHAVAAITLNADQTISGTGLNLLAIPANEPVPGWVLPFVRYAEIVNDNVGKFPLESIGMYRGNPNNNTSNIVSF